MISHPAMISNFDIVFLLISGSKNAVNKVMEDRQTNATGTVENLIAEKKNIQCPPTIAPVNSSWKKVFWVTLKAVLLMVKYKKSDMAAIKTLYQTNCTAAIDISWPNIPVKPQINTVKWSMSKFLLIPEDMVLFNAII